MNGRSKFQLDYEEAVNNLVRVCYRAQGYQRLPQRVYDELVTARLKLWIVREWMRREAQEDARSDEAAGC